MFKLHKQKSDKLGEKFDFKLSNLQALQVPKGWDRLSVSIVSVETGKAVGKSAKAPVWNGSCQWTETFSESALVPTSDDGLKDAEGCLLMVVVFMGSPRSGMLGEATVNLATFMSSRTSFPLSLPLKKCSHGTILQMKVQCLNPRTKTSDEPGKGMISSLEEATSDYDDIETKSDVSDNLSRVSSGSASSNHMDAQFHPVETVSRDTSFSASGSHYSFDSGEGSVRRETLSPQRSLSNDNAGQIGRQDSASSNTSFGYDSPARSNRPLSLRTSRSRKSFQNEDSQRTSRNFMGSPLRSSGTSKELIEAVEVTVEEGRDEARMWEKNARKVTMDLEHSQKKFLDELERREALESELSASKTECGALRREIGELKLSLEEMNLKQNAKDGVGNHKKELEGEIKFLNESNTNLSIQLQKTQESNIELVSILQEMEETIEKQRKEIADLLVVKSEDKEGHEESRDREIKPREPSDSIEKNVDEESSGETSLLLEIESLKLKVQELERDCSELTDENLQLLFKLKESQNLGVWDAPVKESPEDEALGSRETELESRVLDLENELSAKDGECSSLKKRCSELEAQLQTSRDEPFRLESEVLEKELSAKDREGSSLKARCSELEAQLQTSRDKAFRLDAEVLEKELSAKNGECSSLKARCSELEAQLQTSRDEAFRLNAEVCKYRAENDDREIRFAELEQQLKECKTRGGILVVEDAMFSSASEDSEMMKGTYFVTQSNQDEAILNKLADMRRLVEREDCDKEITGGPAVENTILSLDRQLGILHETLESKLRDLSRELLDKFSEVDKIKADNVLNQDEVRGLRDRERELEARVSEIEEEKSQLVLANEVLTRKSSDLEHDWDALEDHISELKKENVGLSGRIGWLEAQLRYLTDEKETSRSALQSSESCCLKLQEDVRELELGLEAQKADLRGKLSEVQKQLVDSKDECGYLKIANRKLEATAESVIEECSLLQTSNALLRAENLELNGSSAILQAELTESKRAFDQLLAEIEVLREKYDTVLEETALKERALNAELDAILLENRRINPSQGEITSSVSGIKSEDELYEESEAKVLELMAEHSASKQSEEVLMAEREKLLHLLENFKSNEAKLKSDVRRLELKLKRSDYERMHLDEEISALRDQLQKTELLQDEVLNLRRTLDEAKFENEHLEATFQVLLGDYEVTKSERDLFSEKISSMESALRELETCRDRKVTLEERVFRLEGDLTACEALYAEDAELKNELARIRRTNSQLQRRVQEHERRAQALEVELKQTNGTVCSSVSDEPELQREEIRQEESHTDLQQTEGSDGPKEDPLLKIQSLEIELAEALEANVMYKEQLKSLLSNGAADGSDSNDGESGARESVFTEKVSSLANELRELRESYFHMSLKYAQGEADREEMMMRFEAM